MATVTGTRSLAATFTHLVSTGVITPQKLAAGISVELAYATSGTGAGQGDLLYAKQLTLAATPTTLDLTALPDVSGATVNFARVREHGVQVVTTTSGRAVILGGAATNPWAHVNGVIVPAGGVVYFADPSSVGSGIGAVVTATSKSYKLDPGANSIVVNVLFLGASAVS